MIFNQTLVDYSEGSSKIINDLVNIKKAQYNKHITKKNIFLFKSASIVIPIIHIYYTYYITS